MGRNYIGRRIYRTYVKGTKVNPDNTMEDFTTELAGKLNLGTAQRIVQRMYRTNRVIVDEVSHDSVYASMSVEKFLAEADILSDHKEEE